MGLETIRSLVVVASLFEAIDLNDDKLPFHRQFGNEALAIASIAKSIAGCEGSSQGKIDECFCAGLLSQLGNILFLMQPPELFESYREVSRVTPTKRLELERDLYGTTHAEVGAYLLSIWGFSHRIVGAVLHHHNPAIMDEKNFDTTTIVHIAESLMSGTDNCLDEAHIERLGKGHRISVWRETAAEIIENGVVSMIAQETVLLVDDEERLLNGLRRQLRGEFEIVTAVGGERALEILESQSEIAVIISDMRMPGVTGVEVLEAFSKKSPTTTRIMLTGNAEQDCAVDAINKSHVFGFLNKPCSTDSLIQSIESGLAHHRLLVGEKKLMETTLAGSIKLLADVVSLMDPATTLDSRKMGRWAGF